ncbi:hypothetical protein ACHAXA_003149 [Cyclostephanos tholiformis]|uniref:Uncharacterized protein n=1 Tax=Cyclostephanos tholiformis TaxID=382380 RepID=A0ABD3SSM6_9STRA
MALSTTNAAKPAALLLHRCLAAQVTRAPRRAPISSISEFRFTDERTGTNGFHTLLRDGVPLHLHPSHSSSRGGRVRIRGKSKMIPRKAALALTPKARDIFRKMISATGSEGILLKYEISSQHALRMAFKFDLIKDAKVELTAQDEGVSLEVLQDGVTPKPPSESWNDNLPKLYIQYGAFMKVLGGTLDVDFNPETGEMTPKLLDREGFEMDPNA